MRRFFITLTILLAAATAASAQHRSAGVRIGATGIDAVYQYNLNREEFVEGGIGLDFGAKGGAGFKLTAAYNIILARPAWTNTGSWALYAGPAMALGNVYDNVAYEVLGEKILYPDNGFMFAVGGQAGVEYSFDFHFPLMVSLDIRPMIGTHVNDGRFRDPATNLTVEFESKSGMYTHGLLRGFIPHLSVRYRF